MESKIFHLTEEDVMSFKNSPGVTSSVYLLIAARIVKCRTLPLIMKFM